jgi:hypothetical protein
MKQFPAKLFHRDHRASIISALLLLMPVLLAFRIIRLESLKCTFKTLAAPSYRNSAKAAERAQPLAMFHFHEKSLHPICCHGLKISATLLTNTVFIEQPVEDM